MALTIHADASVNTDLWTVNTAGVFSSQSVDNGAVDWWDDVEHGAWTWGGSGHPVWRSSTPVMLLPCISFDGPSSQRFAIADNANTVLAELSDVISNSAFTVLVAFRVSSVTTSSANPYDNEAILSATGGFWGAHLRNTGSGYTVQVYNWDGAATTVTLPITLDTDYVLMMRHESGTLYASLNGGSESSVASGNTTTMTGPVYLGFGSAGAAYMTGRIGEVAIYNTALTGGTLATALVAFITKWLSGGGGGGSAGGCLVGGRLIR